MSYGQDQSGYGQNAMVPAGGAGFPGTGLQAPAFSHTTYKVTRPWLSFLGRKFYVYAPDGALTAYVKKPVFKLKQEFTIFADEQETRPILTVRQRQLIGLNIAHDVFDSASGQKVGTIRHKGLKSIIRDEWELLDAGDQVVGLMQEDGAALLRRFFPILTGKWHVELGGQPVARVNQLFKFFAKEFTVDLSESQGRIDPRFAIACALFALFAEAGREDRS
jgi:uncharacterized protein YxjI